MKRMQLFITLFAMLSLAILPQATSFAEEQSEAVQKMNEIYNLIETYHVGGADEGQLTDAAIEGMISKLNDPYTQYFTPSEWEKFQNSLENNYVGIGVRVGEDEKGFFVVEVFPKSPAEAAGITRGDYITEVEGNKVKGKKIDELVAGILGNEGTEVTITIQRDQQIFHFQMTRRKIEIPVVTSEWFEEGKVGYLRLTSFSGEADELFSKELDDLKKQGINSLIVDLRNNPGGYLDTASQIAKEFIKEGTLIHTRDRDQRDVPVMINDGKTFPYPLVVLVNENSASASEVLTGALQDYGLATVIGGKTFGKGSVQSLFPLSGGGALKVTIQEYLTPHKHEVNHKGITPDIKVAGDAAQLVAALYKAGVRNYELNIHKNVLSINKVKFSNSVKLIRKQGKVYMPSRLLASLIDGQIQWNAPTQSVEITKGLTSTAFSTTSSTGLTENGTSYIELDYFMKEFSGLQWKAQGDSIQIQVQVKKEN